MHGVVIHNTKVIKLSGLAYLWTIYLIETSNHWTLLRDIRILTYTHVRLNQYMYVGVNM